MEGAVNFKPSEFRVGTGEFGCRDYCWGARYGFEGDESLVHIHTRFFKLLLCKLSVLPNDPRLLTLLATS